VNVFTWIIKENPEKVKLGTSGDVFLQPDGRKTKA
jgi:hypothetical protein